jgi:hypothetical protein
MIKEEEIGCEEFQLRPAFEGEHAYGLTHSPALNVSQNEFNYSV